MIEYKIQQMIFLRIDQTNNKNNFIVAKVEPSNIKPLSR